MDGLNGLNFNISAYRENTRTRYSQLNWEAIAHIFIVLPVLITIVATCNVKSNYYHKLIRLLSPAIALASGIRLFFAAEEINTLSGKIATLNQQEELGLKQILGTDHWRQGKVLGAIAQSQLAEYLPSQPQVLPPVQGHNAPHYVGQGAAHYAPQLQSPAYGTAQPQNAYTGNSPSFDLSSLGEPKATGFDWSQVTKFHHLLIIGVTGGGKTTLVQWIVSTFCQGSDVLVVDPHYKPGEWEGLTVMGKGRNFQEAEDAIARVRSEMDKRYKKRAEGVEDWNRLVVIIDELPALISSTVEVKDIIPALSQEARKVDIVLVILATGWEVATLGLEGKGSQRNNFTKIEMGTFACKKAEKLKDPTLLNNLRNTPRSCLVDEKFAVIPDLSNFHSGNSGNNPQDDGNLYQSNGYSSQTIAPKTFSVSSFQGQNQDEIVLETETRIVKALLDNGVNDTQIIKTAFGISPGRNWEVGKQKLAKIKIRLGINKPTLEIEEAIESAGYLEKIYQLWDRGVFSPEEVVPIVWGVKPDSSDWLGTIAYYEKLVDAK